MSTKSTSTPTIKSGVIAASVMNSSKSTVPVTTTTTTTTNTNINTKERTINPNPVLSKTEKTTPNVPISAAVKTEKSSITSAKSLSTSPKPEKIVSSPDNGFSKKNSMAERSPGLSVSPPKREGSARAPSTFMDKSVLSAPEITSPLNVMVTGASRGIGLALVQEFLNNRSIKRVIATTRKSEDATDIKKKITDSRLIVVLMDVTDDDSIEKAYESVSGILEKEGLTVLINNAGSQILYNVREKPKRADLLRQMDINAISPIVVTQIFLPLLLKAADVNPSTELSVNRAAVINISDVAGSIALNNADLIVQNPLKMAYRMSKSALNSATRSLSLDLSKDGILFTSICPGWVRTDMGTQAAELTLEDSMAQLVPTICGLRTKHNGCFIQQDGKPIVF